MDASRFVFPTPKFVVYQSIFVHCHLEAVGSNPVVPSLALIYFLVNYLIHVFFFFNFCECCLWIYFWWVLELILYQHFSFVVHSQIPAVGRMHSEERNHCYVFLTATCYVMSTLIGQTHATSASRCCHLHFILGRPVCHRFLQTCPCCTSHPGRLVTLELWIPFTVPELQTAVDHMSPCLFPWTHNLSVFNICTCFLNTNWVFFFLLDHNLFSLVFYYLVLLLSPFVIML